MTWHPLVADRARRDQVAQVVRELVTGIAAVPGVPPTDLADQALLRTYLAQDDLVPDNAGLGAAALSGAIAGLRGGALRLHGGTLGIGFAVAHAAGEELADRICAPIDAAALATAGSVGDYDLIGGITGFGIYALERGEVCRPLALRVVDELERRALPILGGLGWHTAPDLLPPWQRELAPAGYWNLGVAHGIPGVVALLARFILADVEPARCRRLLDGAMTMLDAIAPPSLLATTGARFGATLPGAPTDDGAKSDPPGRRLAWCYNDLGFALVLVTVAAATGEARHRHDALALARSCAARSESDAAIRDSSLCHGTVGAMHLFNRLGHALADESCRTAARTWLDRALAQRRPEPVAGFPSRTTDATGAPSWYSGTSLLDGASGVALALAATISEIEPAWDRLLLADLDPLA